VASAISHPAVPLALAVALGTGRVPPGLAAVACVASVLPDIDAIGFAAGIPYGHPLGHRGLTHSLMFALAIALVCCAFSRHLGASRPLTLLIIFVSTASHGLLDAMTTGGLGVAFFSPFSNARYFLPWRVILVSPIGLSGFLSSRGLQVLRSEWTWIWVPALALASIGLVLRKVFSI